MIAQMNIGVICKNQAFYIYNDYIASYISRLLGQYPACTAAC